MPIIVGLDIGTTKIAAIAGRKNEFGKLDILGFGRANSNGVQHGQVLNIDQTIKAIQQALQTALKAILILKLKKCMLVLPDIISKACKHVAILCGKMPDIEIERSRN